MLGTSLQFGGLRGEDQFYIPVKARKNQNQNQRKKTQRDNKSEDSVSKNQLVDSENKNFNEDSHSLKNKSSSCCDVASNIDRFLESTTPLVPAQYFSKVDFVCLLFNYEFSLSFECLICALFDFEGTILLFTVFGFFLNL
jgi:hypothetical protein